MSAAELQYPVYHLLVDGKSEWYEKHTVGSAYDNGWAKVDFGAWVIDAPNRLPREMSDEDRRLIRNAADDYSASK